MIGHAKIVTREMLPGPIYRGKQEIRRKAKRAVSIIHAIGMAGLFGLPKFVLTVRDFGLGDHLLCTAVLHELRQRGQDGIWIMSDYPELFAGSDHAERVVPVGDKYENFMRVWRRRVPYLFYALFDGLDQDVPPPRHIIAELCARAEVTGSIALRPYLKLTCAEKAEKSWARGCIVIQSSVMSAKYPMLNKQWDPERFQRVVDALYDEFEIVQLGLPTDPELQHVKDLRGVTSVRQSAAILHNARLYIGGVGFLMHLARAVECPSVIVYGGREAPWQSGYVCNVNLYTPLPCAPCWRRNTCDFDRKCMRDIQAEDVVRGVRDLLGNPKAPLPVEHVDIGTATA
jgi:hypothetical protein